jgi:uncharacterized protein YidB (DUF937 family)
MRLFDSLLSSVGSVQNSAIGNTLLSLLASESGRTNACDDKMGTQSPAAISSGLSELVQRFEQGGLGDVIQSWIGSGPNQPISTDKLHQAIGPETVDRLSQNTGMAKGELLPLIAQMLPTIVDRLTPNQHVPDEGEISRMQSNPPIET